MVVSTTGRGALTMEAGTYPVLDSSGGRPALYHIRSMYTILYVLTTQLHDTNKKHSMNTKNNIPKACIKLRLLASFQIVEEEKTWFRALDYCLFAVYLE